jgi:hypothetical protein
MAPHDYHLTHSGRGIELICTSSKIIFKIPAFYNNSNGIKLLKNK